MENKEQPQVQRLSFMSIDPFIDRLIVSGEEIKSSKDYILWGRNNDYPSYLKELAKSVTTLRGIIQGFSQYVTGDDVIAEGWGALNRLGETPRDIVSKAAKSIGECGGVYLLITQRLDMTGVASVEVLPFERVRSNEDADLFWYNEDWKTRKYKPICYPKWMPNTKEVQTVMFIKLWGDGTYPEPIYSASVKACEIERSLDDFHLGNIKRGFFGSYLVNFNNGVPSDEIKRQIERDFTQKFAGADNAGRIIFSFNDNKEVMTTIQKMEVADYGEKYRTLAEHCRQQIFTAFRSNPNLFGIPTEGNGFANEEYAESFKLYNRTQILPVQRILVEAFGKLGITLVIRPFTMEGTDKNITDNATQE